MISYIKILFLSSVICYGFNNTYAYPSGTADIRSAVDQKVDQLINDLNLHASRETNMTAAGTFGLATLIFAAINVNGDTSGILAVSLGLCIYNIYRAVQKTKLINNLEEIKNIVHNHVSHLYGYVR